MQAYTQAGFKPDEEVNFSMQIDPRHWTMDWKHFRANYPRYAVAVDGYVPGGVKIDFSKPIATFDHHLEVIHGQEDSPDVDRLSMRAACGQIMMAVQQGFFSVFRDQHGPRVKAYFKKCNEDDCFSYKLLKEPHLIARDYHGRLEELVNMADKVDTTVGTYCPPGDSKIYNSLIWVTDPYREFRQDGGLDRHDPKEYLDIMDQVSSRIDAYINGTHRQLSPDTSYETLGGGPGWIMIKETGKQGRLGAIQKGNKAIVTVRELPNGKYAYVFFRLSSYVAYFNLPYFLQCLNAHEAEIGNTTHLWGGSGDMVIGSPWSIGTDIDPQTMALFVNTMISHHTSPEILHSLPKSTQLDL